MTLKEKMEERERHVASQQPLSHLFTEKLSDLERKASPGTMV